MRTFVIIILCLLIQFGCKDKATDPPKTDTPPPPQGKFGCPFIGGAVDDTTRQYVFWGGGIKEPTNSYVFTRFSKGTADSTAMNIARKYGLELGFHAGRWWGFCVPEGRRAEEFFTSYGKPQKITFGNEDLVEVAFAIFQNGATGYLDELLVMFDSTVTRDQIDSINSIYNTVVDDIFTIADKPWYLLRVTKQSPYSSFDMANLYHCLKEVVDSTAHANIYGFNPPLGNRCMPVSSQSSTIHSLIRKAERSD